MNKIRLYSSPEASIVSFSPRLHTGIDETIEKLGRYLITSGRVIAPIDTPDELSHLDADTYYEIQPPLGEEQLKRFANACLNYTYNGHTTVEFIDNRVAIPARPSHIAGEIINYIG